MKFFGKHLFRYKIFRVSFDYIFKIKTMFMLKISYFKYKYKFSCHEIKIRMKMTNKRHYAKIVTNHVISNI